MGFTPNDGQEESYRREMSQLARGDIKPGFLRNNQHGAFAPVPNNSFTGLDCIVLCAEYGDDNQITLLFERISYLKEQRNLPLFLKC